MPAEPDELAPPPAYLARFERLARELWPFVRGRSLPVTVHLHEGRPLQVSVQMHQPLTIPLDKRRRDHDT